MRGVLPPFPYSLHDVVLSWAQGLRTHFLTHTHTHTHTQTDSVCSRIRLWDAGNPSAGPGSPAFLEPEVDQRSSQLDPTQSHLNSLHTHILFFKAQFYPIYAQASQKFPPFEAFLISPDACLSLSLTHTHTQLWKSIIAWCLIKHRIFLLGVVVF